MRATASIWSPIKSVSHLGSACCIQQPNRPWNFCETLTIVSAGIEFWPSLLSHDSLHSSFPKPSISGAWPRTFPSPTPFRSAADKSLDTEQNINVVLPGQCVLDWRYSPPNYHPKFALTSFLRALLPRSSRVRDSSYAPLPSFCTPRLPLWPTLTLLSGCRCHPNANPVKG